jgi:Protein of unknown function (DUF2004)
MKTYTLPYFGEIELKPLKDYHYINIEFKGKTISIDLNFKEETISKEALDMTNSILGRLESFYTKTHERLLNEFKKEGDIDYYIDEVIECMDEDVLEEILSNADKNLDQKEQILSQIYLKRVGIYPNDSNKVILDYTISAKNWDDLIVFWMNPNGEIDDIGIES